MRRINLEEVLEVIGRGDEVCDILKIGFDRKKEALRVRSSATTIYCLTWLHSQASCWVVVASGRDAISRDCHFGMRELPDAISVT